MRRPGADLDVCGIGSALVDVLVEATLEQVMTCGLVKGSMQLMDLASADVVHARAPGGVERSGGSVANTAAGLASLGARAAFIGKVADDRFGSVFASDLDQQGVVFGRASGPGGRGAASSSSRRTRIAPCAPRSASRRRWVPRTSTTT